MPPKYLAVGRVARPHGVRGDLLLHVLTDFPEYLTDEKTVYLGDAAEPHALVEARFHRGDLIVRLGDCADRDTAEKFRGQLMQIKFIERRLPPGRYYHHQIIGLRVVTETGEALGTITDIIETGANDVYVVRATTGPELLIPALKSVMLNVDLAAGQMTVHLPDGLR
jgi:16S rRNA processing protein RimM